MRTDGRSGGLNGLTTVAKPNPRESDPGPGSIRVSTAAGVVPAAGPYRYYNRATVRARVVSRTRSE